jgi:hypothetical protein
LELWMHLNWNVDRKSSMDNFNWKFLVNHQLHNVWYSSPFSTKYFKIMRLFSSNVLGGSSFSKINSAGVIESPFYSNVLKDAITKFSILGKFNFKWGRVLKIEKSKVKWNKNIQLWVGLVKEKQIFLFRSWITRFKIKSNNKRPNLIKKYRAIKTFKHVFG